MSDAPKKWPAALALAGSLLGFAFAMSSTLDYARHLDRQVHDIHCSFVPGMGAEAGTDNACRVAMYSPFAALFRESYWGGVPIAIFAVGAFAFFAAFSLYLLLAGPTAPRRAAASSSPSPGRRRSSSRSSMRDGRSRRRAPSGISARRARRHLRLVDPARDRQRRQAVYISTQHGRERDDAEERAHALGRRARHGSAARGRVARLGVARRARRVRRRARAPLRERRPRLRPLHRELRQARRARREREARDPEGDAPHRPAGRARAR